MTGRLSYFISLLLAAQNLVAGSQDGIQLNKNCLSKNLFESYFTDTSFENCYFIDSNLDSSEWMNVDFKTCTLKNTEYIRHAKLHNYHFDKGYIVDFSLYKSEIDKVYFENSHTDNLEFVDCHINTLVIKNCTSRSIKIRSSNTQNIKIIGGSIENLEFIDDNLSNVEIGHIDSRYIIFKSGIADHVKLVNITFKHNSKIEFIETEIHYPRIAQNDINKIDFTRAIFDFKTFQLLNDFQCDIGAFSKTKSRNIYLEARDSYYLLNKQFENAGILQAQTRFEFLMNEAYSKSLEDNLQNRISILWNKYLRGHYGLYPFSMIYPLIWLWLIFGFIYLFLGRFSNIAWALVIPLDIENKVIPHIQPKFIVQSTWNSSPLYLKYCLLFSLQQLLTPSFINSGLPFFKGIGFSQKILIPIGIGKLFSFTQYLVGLVLLFNFIQAFIRSL